MFKRTCVYNRRAAIPSDAFGQKALYEKISFFIITLILFIFFYAAPVFSENEKAVEKTSSMSASASQDVKPGNGKTVTPSPKDTTSIVVNVIVNTESRGDFFAEMDNQQNLYLKLEDVKTLKLNYPENRIVVIRGDEQYVPVSSLLDVSYTFDEKKLTVVFIGKTTESGKTAADLFSLQTTAKNIYYPKETSAFLNYGLNYAYSSAEGFQSFSVTNKLGFRTGDVFFTSDSLYTKMEDNSSFVRLQSNATYERRKDLQWFVLGDQYANSGNLGSTVNMGGIGFSKVYRLDPYFITQPVMDLRGSVIFPTQAEIYLDGVLIGKQAISPGSFELKNLYSYTGSHNVEILLKDPFGNVQKISYLAYFSSQLLRKGLHEYSYNVGFLREQYGVESDDYGNAVFSAFHRYGITNSLNIGARAEGTNGVYNGGISAAILVPIAGSFALSLAGSSANDNASGGAFSFQHSYQLGSFNTNVLLRGYTRDYATVGNPLQTADSTQYEMNLGMGLQVNPLGSFSLNYAETNTFKGSNTQVFSANYSRVLFSSVSLFATASATRIIDTNYSCFVGLNFDLGKGIRGSAQVSGGSGDVNTETLQVQKDMPLGEGLGYRATLNRSETSSTTTTSLNPYVQYNAKYGIYSIDANIQNTSGSGYETYNLGAAGSLVYAGGFYGLSRPVSDSFGIVKVNNKVADADVLANGQRIGKTDSSGTLIVPTLSSYGRNQVTLDTKNIPIDYAVSDVNRMLSPSLWSGSCIFFDAQQMRSLTGTLVMQKEGKKSPMEYLEISMKVGDRNMTYPTGKGGEFYIENAIPVEQKEKSVDSLSCSAITQKIKSGGNVIKPGTYPAFVESGDGKCTFTITFPDTKEQIIDLGEIICTGANAPAPAVDISPSQAPSAKESKLLKNKLYYEEDEANLRGSPSDGSPPSVQVSSLPQASKTPPVSTSLHAPQIPSPNAAEQNKEKNSFILRVRFKKDVKYAVDKTYPKYVKKLADFMKEHPEVSIEIIGHTDNTGKEGYSVLLSQKRADSVGKYLIDGFGIDASRIHAIGYDAARPIADNRTKEGRLKNNRIEVVIEGLNPAPVSHTKEAKTVPESHPPVKEVTPVQAPAPARQTVPDAVVKKQEKVSIVLRVRFEKTVKSAVDKSYPKYVKKLADFMKAHPETNIEIIGHTDNAGKEGYNILLSQRRADNVKKYLMDEFGIDAARINAIGYGSSKPITDNKTGEGRQKNSRIEVVIEGLESK